MAGITAEKLRAKAEGRDEVLAFAVERDGELIGLAQIYEEADPDNRHAGIDLFIGSPYQGQGPGIDTVRTLAHHLVRERGHHRLVIDPAVENERAVR